MNYNTTDATATAITTATTTNLANPGLGNGSVDTNHHHNHNHHHNNIGCSSTSNQSVRTTGSTECTTSTTPLTATTNGTTTGIHSSNGYHHVTTTTGSSTTSTTTSTTNGGNSTNTTNGTSSTTGSRCSSNKDIIVDNHLSQDISHHRLAINGNHHLYPTNPHSHNNDTLPVVATANSVVPPLTTTTTTTEQQPQLQQQHRPQPPILSIASNRVHYTDDTIIANYTYQTTIVHDDDERSNMIIQPIEQEMIFCTKRHVPKLGVMLVGLGGNNGCTCVAGTIANKYNMTWETKSGTHTSNYLGSIFMSSTTKIGNSYRTGQPVYKALNTLLPMVHPNDIVWSGWDINNMNLGDAMKRAQVLDYNLQQKLYPYMKDIVPLPSIYFPDYIAANQNDRANNVLSGTKYEQMNIIRQNIRDFRAEHNLDKVIVVWTANTERFTNVQDGIHDTAENLIASVQRNDDEISASTIFAMASIYEKCTFINGSPQNTFVPGVIELAIQHNVFIAGDDFKSGQTKMKSVLVDFLVSAGIKPLSIVSYNHLGNNDGKNLSAPSQFRSKEISKSNVVDDMVASNPILYPNITTDHPDHVVVIKYVPAVADSKRAMDEYTSEIFMGGKNTIVIHNTCEDSLLATPLIYDLIILAELCERITVKSENVGCSAATASENGEEHDGQFESFHPVLSLLSYLLKAPLVPNGTPIVNALFPQREAITNVLRACLGLPPNNHMSLEHRFASSIRQIQERSIDDNQEHSKI